jgi:hypothetical protein
MMKKGFLLSVLAFSLSCGKDNIRLVDNRVKNYVELFRREAFVRNIILSDGDMNVEIRFDKLKDGIRGSCFLEKNLIILDSVTWFKRDSFDNEWVIYHELGHCILKKEHSNENLARGECKGLMSNHEGNQCFINFKSPAWRKWYFDELFGIKNDKPLWYDDPFPNGISYTPNDILLNSEISNKEKITLRLDVSKSFGIEILSKEGQNCFGMDSLGGYIKMLHCVRPNLNGFFSKLEILENSQFTYLSQNDNYRSQNNTIRIIKKNNLLYFYSNELLIHILDSPTFENNQLIMVSLNENKASLIKIFYLN